MFPQTYNWPIIKTKASHKRPCTFKKYATLNESPVLFRVIQKTSQWSTRIRSTQNMRTIIKFLPVKKSNTEK